MGTLAGPAVFFQPFESGLSYENGWSDKPEVRISGVFAIRNRFIVRAPESVEYCGHPGTLGGQEVKAA
ncbi:hypothetical protein [Paenibacillus typhae]|uniref:hypothetical protein n=1 Tax=Paenibacillus typhae TaxID=1174501 RepID=UPI001C8DBE96|nr:hypothetical protein [Paenibacillus typhae]